jgi:hypothetical protein
MSPKRLKTAIFLGRRAARRLHMSVITLRYKRGKRFVERIGTSALFGTLSRDMPDHVVQCTNISVGVSE